MSDNEEKSEKREALFTLFKPTKNNLIVFLVGFVLGFGISHFVWSLKIKDYAGFVNAIYEKQARQKAERIIKDAENEVLRMKVEAKNENVEKNE